MLFRYTARTKRGEAQNGTVEAATHEAALDVLRRNNLVVVSLVKEESSELLSSISRIFERIKSKDIVIFSRQLATLFDASVPLVESLRTIGIQVESAYFKSVLNALADDVDGGTSFSQALIKYPKAFSQFYVSMVESGEVSGRLQESLEYLANHEEKEYALMQKVRGALIYPIAVICVFILIAVLMMLYVMPNLTGVLKDLGAELPISTKILIATSEWMATWWFAVPLGMLGIFFGGRWYVRTPGGKVFSDTLMLRLPILGDMFTKIYIARIAENLSTLIKGGLPIIKALEVTAKVVGNAVFAQLVQKSMEEVRAGNTISSVFQKEPRVPPMVGAMISVGERSGKVDSILASLARFYSREVDNMVANLTTLIEPIIIVVLGGAVAGLVSSILLPIYSVVSNVQ